MGIAYIKGGRKRWFMENVIKLILLTMVALPLVACQQDKSNSRTSVRSRTTRGDSAISTLGQNPGIPRLNTNSGGPGSPSAGRVWGSIYGMAGVDFQQSVQNFVSSTMDPNLLGTVSSNYNDSTGIRFWGYVETQTGQFNPTGGNNVAVTSANSALRVVIWDSYAGSVDANGQIIPEYPVYMQGTAGGTIQGNRADITFTDGFGYIYVYGTFDASYFQGYVWYDNNGGAANHLGAFYIPTCSFFRCN